MGGKSGGGTAQPQAVGAGANTLQAPAAPAPTGTPTGGKGSGKGGGGIPQLQQRFDSWMANRPATANAPAIGGIGTTGGIASLAAAPQSSMFADASGNAGAGAATVDPNAPQTFTGIAGIPGTETMANAWNKMQQVRALQGVSGQRGLGLGREGGIGKGNKGGGGEPQRQFMQQQTPNGVAPDLPTMAAARADLPVTPVAPIQTHAIHSYVPPVAAPAPAPIPAPAAAPVAARAAPAQLSDFQRQQANLQKWRDYHFSSR